MSGKPCVIYDITHTSNTGEVTTMKRIDPFILPAPVIKYDDAGDNGGMSLIVETIPPGTAAKYLENNVPNNRPISQPHVDAMARDMANDLWALNGETLKFSETHLLLDGQQRLLACIAADKPFTTAVVRGVQSLDDVDRARPRTLGHALGMRGFKQSTKLSVVLNTVWRWEFTNWRAQQARPTVQEAVVFLREHEPLLYAGLRFGSRLREIESSLENASLVFWRVARTCGQEVAERVYSRLAKSEWSSLDDPLFRYYELALRAKRAPRKPNKLVKMNWLVRAIDATLNFERHTSYHFLRWNAGKELRLITGEEMFPYDEKTDGTRA